MPCNSERPNGSQTFASFYDPFAPVEITQANLPHWKQKGATYFITFRLVDSLPAEKLEQWSQEREAWLARRPKPLLEEDWAEYHQKFSARLDHWLDQGVGSCVLEIPRCRETVEKSLLHFHGQRYELGEYVVASNHVHILVTPNLGDHLSDILHSWKSYTAKELIKVKEASHRMEPMWNELDTRRQITSIRKQSSGVTKPSYFQRQRPVWQKESFDHIVRSSASLQKFTAYIQAHREWHS